MFKKISLEKIEKIVILITFLISITVIFGWFNGISKFLSIIPEGATMKFNTALVFLITGIILTTQQIKGKTFPTLIKFLVSILILIGGLTLGEYLGWTLFPLDNFFIADPFSKVYPGRMSPATAICSILLGIGFIGNKAYIKVSIINKVGVYAQKLLAIISLQGIIAIILSIPSSHKTSFFHSMSLLTSGLFLLIIIVQLLKNPQSIFSQLIKGDLEGSKLTRKILPFIIFFPVITSFFLITGINQNLISADFGLVAYATIFIPLSIIYVAYIALGLNKTDAESHQLENKLLRSNRDLKQFKQGLDQVSIVALTDKRGVITYTNDTFCKISQYSKGELIGNTHAIVNSGYHNKQFFKNMWSTISSGEIWVDEIKNRAKDGTFYWVLTAIVPIRNKKEKITEFMAIRQDITEKKKAEELMLAYVKKLEYKNQELEQFAYVASHDLQEPLRTIINFTDLLAKKKTENFDELSLKSLQFIQDASLRMSQLIKSLLDYNRIDKNSKLAIIDCNELIKEIENDLSKIISEAGAEIQARNLPSIIGYETPLRMLFQNLISNGIKFQKKGVKPQIIITTAENDCEWIFSVSDNGIGISPEHQEKIFSIFQRLHGKDKYEGSGIGLAHCRKIVDLHDGKIWVESKLNNGSAFNFTIKTKGYEKET